MLAACAVNASAQQNWIDVDLGGPSYAGSVATNTDGSLTIMGGGSDIWNGTSACNYYYAWAPGTNWDVICQVTSFSGPDTWSKVELMIDDANPLTGPQGSDAFISVMGTQPSSVTPPDGGNGDNVFGVDQFRTSSSGSADWAQVGSSPTPQYPNAWMKVHRNGSIFQLYYSFNGTTWTNYINIDTSSSASLGGGSTTTFGTAWPNLVAVGIAVTAHNDSSSTLGDATIANLSATFPAVTAPTVLNATVQVTNTSTYVGCDASFSFATTNNSNPNIVLPNYQWYKNSVALPGATGTSLTWLATAADNGAKVYCTATVPSPYNTSVTSVTSATGTVTVASSTIVTNGWKTEIYNASGGDGFSYIHAFEPGNSPPAKTAFVQKSGDNPGGYGNNYVGRTTGYFIPPTTDHYVFFVDVDDNADLWLNTNTVNGTDPDSKIVIAQQNQWAPLDNWVASDTNGVAGGGNPPDYSQNCSYTFTTNGLQPGANGYLLNAGQLYYMELVHSQGGGGDNFGVTYETVKQFNAQSLTNGEPSALVASNHNMAFMSYPDTTPTWTVQPTNSAFTTGNSGALVAQATSGGEFTPLYQWYSNNVAIPGATSTSYYVSTWPSSAGGAQYDCVATSVMSGLSSTSAVVTVQVSSAVMETGWALIDYWYSSEPTLTQLENNSIGASTNVITSPSFEENLNDAGPLDYGDKMSAIFYPPTTGYYDFYINSDDQSDLFVSTDSTPANRRLVAQETEWSPPLQWQGDENTTTGNAQKCSATWTTNTATPWSAGIYLQAGQPYYIEADHIQGTGGVDCEATYAIHGQAAPANGVASLFTGNQIAISVPRSYYVGFTQEPTNVTAANFAHVTFTVAGATDSKVATGNATSPTGLFNNYLAYQWLENGVPIPGATSASFSFGPVSPADNGDQFSCQIRSLGYVNNSGVDIWSNSTIATLTVATGQVLETNCALHQYFGGDPSLSAIEGGTAGTPTWSMSAPAFETDITGTEVADNFSDVELGYFIPQTSGKYVFFVGADDSADLLLSTNSSFANLVVIAQQTSYAGTLDWGTGGGGAQVRSDTYVTNGVTPYANGIPLVAGTKYAMELAHAQGGGGSWAGATAMLTTDPNYPTAPADGTLSIIRGNAIASYFPRCTYVNITNQPQSLTVNNYVSASFSITAGTDSTTPIGPEGDWRSYLNNFLTYQWYKNGVAISGANSATYTMPEVLPTDNKSTVYCETRALGYADASGNPIWVTSQVASLTVVTNSPQLTYATYYTNNNYTNFGLAATNYIILAFSAPMNPAGLANPSTYTLPAGLTLLNIVVNTNDYRSVALGVSGTVTLPINVSVSASLAALGGGLPLANTTVSVVTVPLTDIDIGVPGADPAVPGMMYVEGPQAYTIACEGSDIWGTADGFNFAYEMKTNNFDVVVRVRDNGHTSNWAKGGLMVRETLDADSRDWNIINDPASSDGIEAPDNSGYGANAVECNTRNTTGGASAGWDFNPRPVPDYPNAWVRLNRVGNLLSAFYSTNGTSWTLQATNDPTQVGSQTALPSVVYVGLCTTAHNNDAIPNPTPLVYLNTVDYDNYNSSYVAVAGASSLQARVAGGNITITWTPSAGRLLSSPAISGAAVNWQPITGGTGGSVTIPITGKAMFFRVVNP